LEIALSSLSPDAQKRYVADHEVGFLALESLAPEAALQAAEKILPWNDIYKGIAKSVPGISSEAWAPETALTVADIRNPHVIRWAKIVQEAERVPEGWQRRRWVEAVATKYDTTFSSIYRHIKKYEQLGLAGLKHTKPIKGGLRTWSREAIDYWIGLCLKKEHRKVSKDALYQILVNEAEKRAWQIGGYRSAMDWYHAKASPQLLALQRGGMRALDNTLPPVVRNYNDLAPFEILVGDQHKFDCWVVDDETGEVFRPEGYFWQDLRTRSFYGGALAKKYDSLLMGLALRMGLHIFGAFDSIYTDNGKPELSRYITGIMRDMKTLGLFVRETLDVPLDIDGDGDIINPLVTMPGTHRKAIVRNAKAKMIEGTFNVFEGILRDEFHVPGNVKKLGGSQEENEVDQKEITALAEQGKLLTFQEFALTVFRAMDYYNRDKAHRGVLKEWSWRPRPTAATPMDCLRHCYADGWRPVRLSEAAVDLIFLKKVSRIVDRGRVALHNTLYEHDALVTLNSQRVELRYDPMLLDTILVFHAGAYLCEANTVEYSSMKDMDLAHRKIEEKRRKRKAFAEQYRQITSQVPDFREYSTVPKAERTAALIGKERKERAAERAEMFRERTPEELEAEVKILEERTARMEAGTWKRQTEKPLPERPGYFMTDYDRYAWLAKYDMAGGTLTEDDRGFMTGYEAAMSPDQREYWEVVRACNVAESS